VTRAQTIALDEASFHPHGRAFPRLATARALVRRGWAIRANARDPREIQINQAGREALAAEKGYPL
jgi:hypothetical protein